MRTPKRRQDSVSSGSPALVCPGSGPLKTGGASHSEARMSAPQSLASAQPLALHRSSRAANQPRRKSAVPMFPEGRVRNPGHQGIRRAGPGACRPDNGPGTTSAQARAVAVLPVRAIMSSQPLAGCSHPQALRPPGCCRSRRACAPPGCAGLAGELWDYFLSGETKGWQAKNYLASLVRASRYWPRRFGMRRHPAGQTC